MDASASPLGPRFASKPCVQTLKRRVPLALPVRVSYTLAMPAPETHLFHVEVEIRGDVPRPLRLVMPAWAPGSYLVRDFARHVQDFEAVAANGAPLAWRR